MSQAILDADPKRRCVEASFKFTGAVIIYRAIFNPLPESAPHPLRGCAYFGQVVREANNDSTGFDARRKEHIRDAEQLRPDDSVPGFHTLLQEFGKMAFREWGIVEVCPTDIRQRGRVACNEWANTAEKRWIDENGGVMRDVDGVHGEQTLNLTHGGQGDPRKRWECMQVRSRKKYKDFKAALAHFRKKNGHCRVPDKDKSPCGVTTLGSAVSKVRSHRRYVAGHQDREQELDAMGFIWDSREAAWLDFKAALAHFRKKNGHYRVPDKDKSPCGVTTLGTAAHMVRNNRQYVAGHLDREQELDAMGFIWDSREAAWLDFKAALAHFRNKNGHCRVQGRDESPCGVTTLGTAVSNVRQHRHYVAGHQDREQELDAMGFIWDSREAAWLDFKAALAHFCKENGHCRVQKRDKSPCGVTTLGTAVNNVRSSRRYAAGHPDRLRWLLRHPSWIWSTRSGEADAKVAKRYEACLQIYCMLATERQCVRSWRINMAL